MSNNSKFLVEAESGTYANNDSVPIRVYSEIPNNSGGRDGLPITLQVKMHRFNESIDINNDPTQDTATGTTDRNGIVNLFWAPDQYVPLTDNFEYYAYAFRTDNPALYTTSEEFLVLDLPHYLKIDSTVSLRSFMEIPVYEERSFNDQGGTFFNFTYENWNTFPVPVVTTRFGDTITTLTINTDFEVDYSKGQITLTTPVTAGTEVFCTYKWKFFSGDQIMSSLEDAVQQLNNYAKTTFNLSSFPSYWNPFVKALVACDLIENVWASTIFQERRIVFDQNGISAGLQGIYQSNLDTTQDSKKYSWRMGLNAPRITTSGDIAAITRNLQNNFWIFSTLGLHR